MNESVTATEAKNDFGRILERVIRGDRVVITKHDAPKAIMISVEQYDRLTGGSRVKMEEINRELKERLMSMQTPAARAAMQAAFSASSEELGKAAVAAARKRAR